MRACDCSDRRAEELARSATRAWLGCPKCHCTWSVDLESRERLDHETATTRSKKNSRQVSAVHGCAISALAVSLTIIIQFLLRPILGNASPFLLFTPAVAFSAVYGGVAPGILATAFGGILGHFFRSGVGEPFIEKYDRVILFLLVGVMITASSTMLRRSRQQLSESLWREQKARATAEAADRTKDDFLALVSHELQTPMSVVLGWMATIRERRLDPEALDHALEVVERNARILSRLVDDVLDRSRIATGTLRLDMQVISLPTVVRVAVDQARGRIEASGLRLDVIIPAEEPTVLGDSIRLQQVFTNLLSNAIKFTPRGGQITVTITATDIDTSVTVSDTGSGISADLLPHVFEPFRQGRDTLHQSRQGLGLGLSIVRYLITRHDGTIAAASGGAGCGSAFTVTLPLTSTVMRDRQPESPMRRERRTPPALIQ
jgi:signal transduction histidine kinase